MKITPAVFLMFLIFFCGCSKDGSGENTAEIGVDFVWDLKHPNRSPEVHLENVPNGADRIRVLFFRASNEFELGGGSLPYDGSGVIQAGALKRFKGLRVGVVISGYAKTKVTVEAFDKNGQLVGEGTTTKNPPDE